MSGRQHPAVVCRGLHKRFDGGPVVAGVDLSTEPGDILVLLGPSGCGKTTTLRLIAGFERLDAGEIEISGTRVAGPDGFHLPPERRRAGMVFQDYAIFPHLSVRANVGFGLGRGSAAAHRTEEMLELVGLSAAADAMPHELSGGQQQRIALARALAPGPAVLLLDEPFSNLDAALRDGVRREVRSLLKRNGTTALFVTHDQAEALFLGDRVAVMHKGTIAQTGTPAQVFHQPQGRFVANFLGRSEYLPGVVRGGAIETMLGTLDQDVDLPDGSEVEVMLREDDVRLTPDEEGNGRILSGQFSGIAIVYEVGLDAGLVLHSWQPHTVHLPVGSRVHASVRGDHRLTIFQGERVVGR